MVGSKTDERPIKRLEICKESKEKKNTPGARNASASRAPALVSLPSSLRSPNNVVVVVGVVVVSVTVVVTVVVVVVSCHCGCCRVWW